MSTETHLRKSSLHHQPINRQQQHYHQYHKPRTIPLSLTISNSNNNKKDNIVMIATSSTRSLARPATEALDMAMAKSCRRRKQTTSNVSRQQQQQPSMMPPLVGRLDCFHPFQIPPATVGEPFYYCENDSAPSHALVRQSLTHEMELTSFGGWDSLTSSSTHFAADDMARHTTASHSGKKMKHSKKLSGPTEHRRAKRRRSKHNVPTGLVRSKALKCHLSTLGTSIKPLQRDAPNSISADDNALRTDAFGKPVLTNPATSAFNDISNNTSKNYEPRIPYSHPHLEEIDFANEFDVDSWIDLAEVTAKLTTTYQGGRKTLPDTTLLRKRLASTTLRGPVSVDDTMKMYSGVCRRMNGCLH